MPLTNTIPLKLSTSTNISRFVSGEGVGLAFGGTGVDLSASGGSTFVLAQDASHVISARALVAADIPSLDASKITTGQIALARGGTNADLSATGGTSKFLSQATVGGNVTVVQPTLSDLAAGTLGVDLTMTGRIQFTGAGTLDNTKSLIYSDANAGSIFINCPTSRSIQLLYEGGQKFYVNSAGAVAAGHFYVNQNQYFNGAGAASSTFTTSWADAANGNLFTNVPTGKYEQHRVAGNGLLNLGYSYNVQNDSSWALGKWATGAQDNTKAGIAHYAATGAVGYNSSLSHRFFLGSNNAIASMGTSFNTADTEGWALGLWGTGTQDNTKAGIAQYTNILYSNVPTGKYEQHQVAGNGLLSLGRASSTQGDSAWAIGPYAANGALSATSPGIYAITTSMVSNVPSGSVFLLNFADTSKYRFAAALAEFDRLSLGGTIGSSTDPGAGSLALTNRIQFTGAGTVDTTKTLIHADAANGNLFTNVPTGKYEQHRVAGAGLLSLGRASNIQNDSYFSIGGYASNGATIGSIGGIFGGVTSTVHNVPSGSTHQFMFAGTEKYRFAAALAEFDRLSLGGTIGSSVDPGAGSLALTNRIQFTGAGTLDATKTLIHADASAGNLLTNVPSTKYVGFRVAGYTSYTFGYSLNLATTGANVFQFGDGSGSYIQSDGFGLLHRVSNTYAHTFKVNTTDVGYFDGNGLTVTKNIVSSNNSNAGDRTTNLDVQRYFNNIFWGWPNGAYTCSVGAFNGSGYPFICFYGYHSSTTNTIKRSSATNQPVWLQSLGGYLSIWQGSSGTADTDCTSTEKYRFDAIFQTNRLSIGTTIGSPTDPGSGGIYTSGNVNVAGTITLSGSTPWINTLASGTGVYLQMGAGSANISTIITYTNAYDGGTKRGSMELLAGQVAGASIRVYDKDSNQQLDISEAGCVSVRQNSGGRTANFSALKHFNSYFWGHSNTEYLSTIGAFNSGGQPFIAFYAYHSTTTNTLARASATNVATWIQADTTGYISFFQGNTGTVDGNITGTEKYRFGASLLETSAASFGGTIGSSSNPGAGGIYATGNVNFRGGQKAGVSIKTTTYTATVNDYILLGNHATTAFTINLPAATGSCQVLVIGNINAAVVTVDANGTETIAGALTQTLNQWDSIMICDYGTGTWNILARK